MSDPGALTSSPPGEPPPPAIGLASLFLIFLRFGFQAWGGPVAQIAMIRHELVERRRWVSAARFNGLLTVMQALPGPEAHELCVHMGVRAAGRLGGVLAGLGFMLPGFLMILGLSWAYFAIGLDTPLLRAAFLGVQAAVIALIVRAVHQIGRHVLTDRALWGAAIGCGLAAWIGAPFWITLPASGLAYGLAMAGHRGAALSVALAGAGACALLALAPLETSLSLGREAVAMNSAGMGAIFLAGLKAGLLTFGGAYAAIPFVRDDAVGRGWMDDGQFLDGLALAGVLPAPLIIFSTFVGYAAGGLSGALLMTAGVFLPAFAFSLILYERLETLIEAPRLQAMLRGVTAGVIGLITVTALELAATTARDMGAPVVGLTLFGASLIVLYVFKRGWSVPIVIAAAAATGALTFPHAAG